MNLMRKTEQNQLYISSMRPVLNKRALFSDTTEEYVTPSEPNPYQQIRIRFRTAKNNIDYVFLVCRGERQMMMKESSDEVFDYYAIDYQLENEKISYYFEINVGKVTGYYDVRGLNREVNEYYDFVVIPGFKTPAWAKGAVMYQIYIDRFCNGDPSNDILTNEYRYIGENVTHVEDWNKYPAQMGVREFYGGDLQGVLDKMDYLQELGIEVIYFNPLFVSPSNHKYDIQDYDYIDPHIGKLVEDEGELLQNGQAENRFATRYIKRVTSKANLEASNELFAKVVAEAHRRGIRVILDGVFNHCGSFNKWMDRERIYENAEGYEKGAYVSQNSPYRNYFLFHDPNRWPYNPTYDGWWGHDTLPKLNYEGSKELFDYVMHIARKWVSAPYNVDGWRLDVAADLGFSPEYNHYFWKEFRKAVKEANPDAVILAEHYGDTREWLEPVTWFLTGMQKHSDDYRQDLLGNADSFWGAMRHHSSSFSMPSWQVAMNQLSNHDHSRFMTRTSHKVGRTGTLGPDAANHDNNPAVFREGVVIQMTWPGAPAVYYGERLLKLAAVLQFTLPGVPSVYYGDEAGVCGFTDPDNRRSYPWGHEDRDLIEFHKAIIKIHKECRELRTGSIKSLDRDYNYLAYGRFNRTSQIIVLVNNNDHEIEKKVSVWQAGVPKESMLTQIFATTDAGYSTEHTELPVISGNITIKLPRFSAMILRHTEE